MIKIHWGLKGWGLVQKFYTLPTLPPPPPKKNNFWPEKLGADWHTIFAEMFPSAQSLQFVSKRKIEEK